VTARRAGAVLALAAATLACAPAAVGYWRAAGAGPLDLTVSRLLPPAATVTDGADGATVHVTDPAGQPPGVLSTVTRGGVRLCTGPAPLACFDPGPTGTVTYTVAATVGTWRATIDVTLVRAAAAPPAAAPSAAAPSAAAPGASPPPGTPPAVPDPVPTPTPSPTPTPTPIPTATPTPLPTASPAPVAPEP